MGDVAGQQPKIEVWAAVAATSLLIATLPEAAANLDNRGPESRNVARELSSTLMPPGTGWQAGFQLQRS